MIESSTPPLAALDGYRNVTDLLVRRDARTPYDRGRSPSSEHLDARRPAASWRRRVFVRAGASGGALDGCEGESCERLGGGPVEP